MAKRDFYDVLGVPKGSDEAALKSAYRKLAMQFHPDRNPGNSDAEHKFNLPEGYRYEYGGRGLVRDEPELSTLPGAPKGAK